MKDQNSGSKPSKDKPYMLHDQFMARYKIYLSVSHPHCQRRLMRQAMEDYRLSYKEEKKRFRSEVKLLYRDDLTRDEFNEAWYGLVEEAQHALTRPRKEMIRKIKRHYKGSYTTAKRFNKRSCLKGKPLSNRRKHPRGLSRILTQAEFTAKLRIYSALAKTDKQKAVLRNMRKRFVKGFIKNRGMREIRRHELIYTLDKSKCVDKALVKQAKDKRFARQSARQLLHFRIKLYYRRNYSLTKTFNSAPTDKARKPAPDRNARKRQSMYKNERSL